VKVNLGNFAAEVAAGGCGSTTVAATMFAAWKTGIRVFATGGIGGVHRGAAQSFDISADLQELARTPVTVVCAGAKSILDLGLTLEYLETHGVPVLGYQTDALPAFFCRDSGFAVRGFARTPRTLPGIDCRCGPLHDAGGNEAREVLTVHQLHRLLHGLEAQDGLVRTDGVRAGIFDVAH
jgi:pseudouridine-5'-phosphate glycosidase